MKKLLVWMVLIAGSFLAGCTPVDTAQERNARVNQISDMQMKMLVDDWDAFWLYDQNVRLSRWSPRIGY